MSKYDDIINNEYPYPSNRVKASWESRASQFAPFSALSGYEDALETKSKIKEEKIQIDYDAQIKLNQKLEILASMIDTHPKIILTYYNIDKYINEEFKLKRIDNINKELIMMNKSKVKFSDIIDINCELFKNI